LAANQFREIGSSIGLSRSPFLRRWLAPIDGAPARISLAEATVIVAAYAVLLMLFALVGCLS
jgi:hypothetical protein